MTQTQAIIQSNVILSAIAVHVMAVQICG